MEKAPFYLTKRKLNSGKSVYYFYFYDSKGCRTVPKSTGCTKKNDAIRYCIKQLQKGLCEKSILFKDFSEDWFTPDHVWVKDRRSVRKLTNSTLTSYSYSLNKQLLPYFGDMSLDKISSTDVKNFRLERANKGYSARTINSALQVLGLMMSFALENELITKDPTVNIKQLQLTNTREAFSIEELKHIFSQEWNNDQYKLFNLTLALTGLRISECVGLQLEQIKNGYLVIDRQYSAHGFGTPKGDNRFVPIPKSLEEKLIAHGKGKSFVFTRVDGKPLHQGLLRNALISTYSEKMLLQKDERKLTYHSYRYFFNTYLISNNINSEKVNFVIGHSMGKGSMMRLYTTWRPEMYDDVRQLQDKLIKELKVEDFLLC